MTAASAVPLVHIAIWSNSVDFLAVAHKDHYSAYWLQQV